MENFQYVIPQFIDVEARVIGPVTVRQFITVVVGFFVAAIEYKLFDATLFILAAIVDFLLVGAFGFLRVNGAPFHIYLLNVVASLKRPAVRVWRKEPNDFVIVKEIAGKQAELGHVPRKSLPKSRLRELILIVNTGGLYKEEERAYLRWDVAS